MSDQSSTRLLRTRQLRTRPLTMAQQLIRNIDRRWLHQPQFIQRVPSDRGSVTAEYVIATLAAVSFAGLLVVILRGDEVRQILTEMVRNALTFGG